MLNARRSTASCNPRSTDCRDGFALGGSPPVRSTIPPELAEELAQIIARALVADYRAEAPSRCAPHIRRSSTVVSCSSRQLFDLHSQASRSNAHLVLPGFPQSPVSPAPQALATKPSRRMHGQRLVIVESSVRPLSHDLAPLARMTSSIGVLIRSTRLSAAYLKSVSRSTPWNTVSRFGPSG
jgi:hypothetical protein